MNSEYKNHPQIILYLGAGASYFAGYYTFVGFPELLFNHSLRESEGMPPLSPNSQRILMAIRDSLERNNKATTHDNFLWRLDGYTQFLRLNQSDDVLQEFLRENTRLFDLHTCTEQAIHQISSSTIHHYSTNRVERAKNSNGIIFENMSRVFTLYRALAKLNGLSKNLPIFTTNYDMLIEDLFAEFGYKNNETTCLLNGIPGISQELSSWSFQEYHQRENVDPTFHLHRLHGCVCWFYHAQGDSGIYFHRRDATQQEANRLCAMYPGRETQIGMPPHGYSFRTFYEYLLACDLAVFIGFSFRDDDVMHVLLKAMAERGSNLKILVVDQLYTKNDVRNKLVDASCRSPFPCRLPEHGEIDSLRMSFGTDSNFDNKVLDRCKALLS